MELLIGYCCIIWAISAWSVWRVASNEQEDPDWFLPTDVRFAVSAIAAVLVVLTSPIWFPIAFIEATIRGEKE